MNPKRAIIFLGIIFITTIGINQQAYGTSSHSFRDTIVYKAYKNGFGFNAGFTTGVGFSYRHIFKKFGTQVTIGPYYAKSGDNIMLSCGLTFLYRLSKPNVTTFYLYIGNHYYYDYTHHDYVHSHANSGLNTGIGICLDGRVSERISIILMAGYAQYSSLNTPASLKYLMLTGETGFFYLFN